MIMWATQGITSYFTTKFIIVRGGDDIYLTDKVKLI